MSNKEIKEEKRFIAKGQEGRWKMMQDKLSNKVEGLEDAVFESGAVKHAAQFMKTLEEISKYV